MPRPFKGFDRRKHRLGFEGRVQELFNNARQRAKKANLPFDLTREWIAGALSTGRCAVTGLPLVLDISRSPQSPSLDRVDPAGGYTMDNTRLVCAIFNVAKNVWSDEDVLMMARAMVANNPE